MRTWHLQLLALLGLPVLVIVALPLLEQPVQAGPDLPDRGIAPELTNTVWLNSDHPLHLADLRGQVVLLDFWTVNCINCEHTIPYLKDLYTRLNGQGVQIIGIHFPEFGYERELNTVSQYMQQWGIQYPVAIDNDAATWNAYEMHAWPSFELIDKYGHRRFRWIGEGGERPIEGAIQELLAEPYSGPPAPTTIVPAAAPIEF
ncbi:MAG: redoxin domain-containing protein [Aggregatilineales bacterium]